MGQLQTLDQKINALKSVNEVFSLQDVKERFIKNFEATTGRKDGANRLEQERFAYLQILQDKPDLAKVDKLQHFMALVFAGTTGLSFRDNKLYVIPAGNNKLKVQVSPAGKREMMEMMSNIKRFPETILVMKGDEFVVDKLNGVVKKHESTKASATAITLENIAAAYQRIVFKSGEITDVIVYHDELVKAKAKSKMNNSGPWVDWPGEMSKKTALNRAFRLYHKYPSNVVEFGDIEDHEGDVDAGYATEMQESEIQSQTPPPNVDTETGEEVITPEDFHAPQEEQPKKEEKTKGKSFM